MSVDAMVSHLQYRAATRRAARASRQAELRALLPDLVRLLVGTYGARRVLLFGSLAWGEVDETSDVDLAVEGIPAERIAAAHGALMLQTVVPIDLVSLESAPASLRERIEREGVVLHDRPGE